MASFPYWYHDKLSLTANASGSIVVSAGIGESLVLKNLRFTSTGAFSITDIRDSAGRRYSNCSASEPILSTSLLKAGTANFGIFEFPTGLVVNPNTTLYFDVLDTSGSTNALDFYFECERIVP